jgi:dipeptidyl aminopeptidase/acylaminoacyl peptidase
MFEGVGGVRIAGYVRKPAGVGPFPLVVLLHGGGPAARRVKAGSEAGQTDQMTAEALRASQALGRGANPLVPAFIAQGWAVYSIDFRPNSRYPIDPVAFDDTLAALKKARSFSFVDPQRIAMLGGSHGGHVTGRMASRFELACAVLCAPAGLDLVLLSHLAQNGTPIGGNQGLIRQMEQHEGVKMAEIEETPEAHHYSYLMTEAAKVQCPILVISGRNDPNAPLAAMGAYGDKLRALGTEAETDPAAKAWFVRK